MLKVWSPIHFVKLRLFLVKLYRLLQIYTSEEIYILAKILYICISKVNKNFEGRKFIQTIKINAYLIGFNPFVRNGNRRFRSRWHFCYCRFATDFSTNSYIYQNVLKMCTIKKLEVDLNTIKMSKYWKSLNILRLMFIICD